MGGLWGEVGSCVGPHPGVQVCIRDDGNLSGSKNVWVQTGDRQEGRPCKRD